jgi:maltose alpha-D-glucosyltransferase/alpha-amylase
LRSLDYAVASVGAHDDARLSAPMRDVRDGLLRKFLKASQTAFLAAYRASLGADSAIDENLLQLFVIEKAAYELCYELANRPDWVHVPMRGLIRSIEPEGDA